MSLAERVRMFAPSTPLLEIFMRGTVM